MLLLCRIPTFRILPRNSLLQYDGSIAVRAQRRWNSRGEGDQNTLAVNYKTRELDTSTEKEQKIRATFTKKIKVLNQEIKLNIYRMALIYGL